MQPAGHNPPRFRPARIPAIGIRACMQSGEIMDLLGALTTFVRVADTGSFSAVARQSNSSHSVVTRSIEHLEEHFGVRLFQRSTRRLSLTDDGQNLLAYARPFLETADEMQDAVGRQRASPTGLVRLGIPVAASAWVMPHLPDLVARHPGLAVELVVGDSFGDLIEERLDVALIGWQPPETSAIVRAVGTFGRIAVASPRYLERHGAPSHPAELAHHACIIHERGGDSARWRFRGAGEEIEVQVAGAIRANNSETVRQAALSGYGIARLSEMSVLDDLRADRLRHLLTEFAPMREQLYLVYPTRRHLPPRVRVVIEYMADGVRRLNAHLAGTAQSIDGLMA